MGTIFNGFSVGGERELLIVYSSLNTNGNVLTLDLTLNSDYDIELDFTVTGVQHDKAIIGNTANGGYLHLTMFNNLWYISNGNGETNFSATITGRHTVMFNASGAYFDTSWKSAYTPRTDNTAKIMLSGKVSSGYSANCMIHHFMISSFSTGEVLYDYYPTLRDGVVGLYNIVNNTFIPYPGATLNA